jgi:hypothetical protein
MHNVGTREQIAKRSQLGLKECTPTRLQKRDMLSELSSILLARHYIPGVARLAVQVS